MITVIIASYAILVLTVVFALLAAARRPAPKRNAAVLAELPVRPKKVARSMTLTPSKVHGGTEVLAFGA